MGYQILVLDLDGTLTNSEKIITERTKTTLMRAQQSGVKIVLASGRPTYGIVPLAKELELDNYEGYILSYNGANIINFKTNEIIFSATIPMESIPKIVSLAEEYNVNLLTYEGNSIITDNKESPYAIQESKINQLPLKEIENLEHYINFPVEKFIMLGEGKHLEGVEKKVFAALGSKFSVYRSESYFLEIMPENIDKAQSLAKLLDHLGLTKDEMIACGDGYNDISMLSYAGLSVAMENAVEAAKDAADFITLSNDADGVAYAVEKFIF